MQDPNHGNMVIVTDGGTTTGPDPNAASAAARAAGTTIFSVGIGVTDPSPAWTALRNWADDPAGGTRAFLSPTSANLQRILDTIGAAITGPAATAVSVTETLGTHFTVVGVPTATKGTASVAGGGKVVTWSGFDLGSETVSLTYAAKHDGTADPLGGTEVVSTSSASSAAGPIPVAGGAATVTVEPCEGELVLDQTCQPGSSCSAANVDIGGVDYSIDAGTADVQTRLRALSGVSIPAGVCQGAVPFGDWALWDIRPLTDGGVVITGTIDKDTLKASGKKWFDVRGCWGTNETFPLERGGNAARVDGAYWGTPKTFKNQQTCSVTTVIGGKKVPTVCSTVKNVQGGARLMTFFPFIGNGKYDPIGGMY